MPLDPSIITGGKPIDIQTPSPLDLISGAWKLQDVQAQVEQRRLAADKARQQAADEAQIRSVMAANGGDVDQGIQTLYGLNPRAAAAFEETVGKARKENLEAAGKALDNQKTQLANHLNIWGLVKDQPSLDAIRPLFVKSFPQLDAALPTAYGDGTAVQAVNDAALTRKDQVEQKQKVLDLFAKGDFHAALGNVLSQPDITAEKWDQAITGAVAMGMPKAVGDEFGGVGGFSADNVANAARLAVPAAKRAEFAAKGPTEEQATNQYRAIQLKAQLGQPVTPEEAAWAKAYEKQKTLTVDVSAGAATDRQTRTIAAQIAQQGRAQDFTQLQAARQDIRENVDKPYATAKSGAETLRDVVTAAQAGNKVAASLQNLETTMAAMGAQGFKRINTAEIGATGDAGSLFDHIVGWAGKASEGQSVPANIQKDMLAYADILDKAAYKKYAASHDASNTLYGTRIPRTYAPPAAVTPTPPPAGAGSNPFRK